MLHGSGLDMSMVHKCLIVQSFTIQIIGHGNSAKRNPKKGYVYWIQQKEKSPVSKTSISPGTADSLIWKGAQNG